MKITLLVEGNEKVFSTPFVKARVLRNFVKMQKEKNLNDMDVQTIDDIVELMVDAYNNQFTIDQLYDGIDARELMPTIQQFIADILGKGSNEKGN